jgi:serine/threonine protein kinase
VSVSNTIDELLLRWQELRQQSPRPSVPELCADHPSLIDELTRRIAAFESMEALLGVGVDATLPDRATKLTIPSHLAEKLLPLGYELLEVIDQGGMGVVYKANQVKLGRIVALKMIAGFRAGPKQLARFRVEVEAVARLQHPHIVQIHEVGEVDGHSFFAMEYVDGGTLARRLAAGPLSPTSAAELLETLARAIHHAHTRGIVHRDLKPANILLQKDEGGRREDGKNSGADSDSSFILHPSSFHPKVTDFGVAKRLGIDSDHTATGEIIGTPGYMAPEQAEGNTTAIGPACDVYALGAILYEAITGRPPFQGTTVLETLRRVVAEEPKPPRRLRAGVPADLEAICLMCLEKKPGHRYPSAEELADDLHCFLKGLPVTARPLSRPAKVLKWARRQPVWASVFLLVILAPWAILGTQYIEREQEKRRVIRRAIEVAPQAREILKRQCYECHGANPAKVERNFFVLDRTSLLDSHRKYVVPGHPEDSRLLHRIEDDTMPPEQPEENELRLPRVSPLELSILRDWILGGAPPFPPENPLSPTPSIIPESPLAGEVKAIFIQYCFECHKRKEEKGGIKILNHNLLTMKRRVVIPGHPEESELFQLLVTEEEKTMMPPMDAKHGRLSPEEIETIRKWIEDGAAPFPRTEAKGK